MRKTLLLLLALAYVIILTSDTWHPTPAYAQFAGQGTFQVPISRPGAVSPYTIPACTTLAPTTANPCFPNRGQLGHTITWSIAGDGVNALGFEFQGSNDNSTWTTLAAGTTLGAAGTVRGISYTNGYFSYLQMLVNSTGTFTAVYTGYGAPIAINPVSMSIPKNTIGSGISGGNTVAAIRTPFILNGFQCFNPNNTVSSGTAVFTGAGLNDLTKTGTYSCPGGRAFRVQVDSVGATDTFKWSNDGGASFPTTGVAMTGAGQLLECGLSVTFGAVTGHTLNNRWDFTATDGTAYLDLTSAVGVHIYSAAIPPGQVFNYSGPQISTPRANVTTSFAATAGISPGSASGYGTALTCTFEINPFGPFYPMGP